MRPTPPPPRDVRVRSQACWDQLTSTTVVRCLEFFLKDQSDPESEADRKSTSSSNRSPSTAATVGPNSGSTTVSEVWNYFSKTDAKTVKCSACEFTVTHENVSRQSTAPLWRHLERKHNEEFLKTEFYRIRKRKRVREPAYALDV